MSETVLIVDDEDAVRRTFADWLRDSGLDVEVIAVGDASGALTAAAERTIDLAVLDWNLGAGSDGLSLLQDLYEFQPDICAIMITGFAHQATPLDALRMGVRDYLDKNQSLNREAFIRSVEQQLRRIAPAKREREVNRRLVAFREALDRVLPVVRSAAAMSDGVPLSEAVRGLFRFVTQMTHASDGVLVVHQVSGDAESLQAFDLEGGPLPTPPVAFQNSLAAAVLSMGFPVIASDLSELGVQAQPFEEGRENLLAGPVPMEGQTQMIVELFDKPGGFTEEDKRLLGTAARFGTDLLSQALSERQTHRMLFDAIAAAMRASDHVTETIETGDAGPPRDEVLDQLREGMAASGESPEQAEAALRLAEAIRELTQLHGPVALRHCAELVRAVRRLLDETLDTVGP